jgi:hypothetical protein
MTKSRTEFAADRDQSPAAVRHRRRHHAHAASETPRAASMRRLRARRRAEGKCSECEDAPVEGGRQCETHRVLGMYRARDHRGNETDTSDS